ncbi:rRNA-processing protein UTP23 homolog [Cyclospora cayetanensis]|uniref:rRNA-processing protein UTP23 homolog n=1 Tax=Cyclospora cayetanensis TaxID=88456 RepID=A0A6P6S0X6_9EIME|nr:rRNA-processing protein UTP23 homolog [Cyclospora cayetanensis]
MRVARKKSFKKIMRFYATHFGIQEPYQLIVDGTFLAACIRHKVNVAELLPRVLCGKTTMYVTPCIMKEVRTLPGAQGAAAAAKRYKRYPCKHAEEAAAATAAAEAAAALATLGEEDETTPPQNAAARSAAEGRRDESADDALPSAGAPPPQKRQRRQSEKNADSSGEDGGRTGPSSHRSSHARSCITVSKTLDMPKHKFLFHPALIGGALPEDAGAAKRQHQQQSIAAAAAAAARHLQHNTSDLGRGRITGETSTATPDVLKGASEYPDAYGCIVRLVSTQEKRKLCVATQDARLRERLRRVPGLPLLFLFKGVLQVEQPTKFSLVRAQQQQRASAKGPLAAAAAEKRRLAADRKQQLEKLQQQGVDCSGLLLQQQKEELQKQRELERAAKRKRKKGVNPLACRKSTKMIIEAPKLSDGKKVRSRRVKLSKEDVKPEGS